MKKLRWDGGALVVVWTFASDWKPEPARLAVWEPVFLPVLAGGYVYVPGLGGTIHKVDKTTGASLGRINPFPAVDPSRYVAGGLAADAGGRVYYNALALDPLDPLADAQGAWLVKADPNGTASTVDFATLVPGAPGATDLCEGSFSFVLPWPPSPTAEPPLFPCGSQGPGSTSCPRLHRTARSTGQPRARTRPLRVSRGRAPDLTRPGPRRFGTSSTTAVKYFCPANGARAAAGRARPTARSGDQSPARGRVRDQATSSPVRAAGRLGLCGTSTRYNYSRGHLFSSAPRGTPSRLDFGWTSHPPSGPRRPRSRSC